MLLLLTLLLPAVDGAAGKPKLGSGALLLPAVLLLFVLRGLGDLLMSDVSTRLHARPTLLAARLRVEGCAAASGTTSDSARRKATVKRRTKGTHSSLLLVDCAY
jgi:hypothetical protein